MSLACADHKPYFLVDDFLTLDYPKEMELVSRDSFLWQYLDQDHRALIQDGEHLLDLVREEDKSTSDFSYLVFPVSKAYEGFLKKLFMDTGVIDEKDYYGDEVRIGRILSPNFRKANPQLFNKICLRDSAAENSQGQDLADRLWEAWHVGRNRVFHYFPHNFRRLNYNEALEIMHLVISQMEEAVSVCNLNSVSSDSGVLAQSCFSII